VIVLPVRNQYDTKQRKLIIAFIRDNRDKNLSAEMIGAALAGVVGQTTVYRCLHMLVKEKFLVKIDMPDQKSTYYRCTDNPKICQLMCVKCGSAIDLECSLVTELNRHIRQEHRFQVDSLKTVLYGCCEKCV